MKTLFLTDTHCHFADEKLRNRLPDVLAAALAENVGGFIVPSANQSDWQSILVLQKMPHIRAVAAGIHPWYAGHGALWHLSELCRLLSHNPRLLVGEIGLDFYDKTLTQIQKDAQIELFTKQLQLAQKYARPILLHNLKATEIIVEIVKKTGFKQGGIAHAFSGSLEEAQRLIACGFKIGIGSLLLNPNAKKAHYAAAALPLTDIVLETDSPFGLKNQDNTPANLRQIAQNVASLRGIGLEELMIQTENNIVRLLDF